MKRLLLISSALVLAACQTGGDTSSSEPIKIGFIGPLTGDAAAYGIGTLNGVLLKVEEINNAGGINGRTIEVIAEDGRCTGSDAASAAQKLVNVDKVDAIVGGQCSGETLAAAPIVEAARMVMIAPISSSPDVTDAGDFVFRDYPSDALKTAAMVNYFKEKGYEKVAILSENTDFCVAFRDEIVSKMGEDAIVFNETDEPGSKDYRTAITRLKDIEFDVLLANPQTPATAAAMVQQFREFGFEQPIIGHDVIDGDVFIEATGDAAEGVLSISSPSISEESDFGVRYIAKFGKPQFSLVFTAHAYDAAGVLFEAISNVGTEGPAIRDYFYALDGYDGVIGRFSFDDKGDVIGLSYVLREVQEGEFTTIADIDVN